jgi:adenine-specific DNA-methyltransferase
MKYMGSKRAMLTNGLGVLIDQALAGRTRFVDLFSGSAAVSKFVATKYETPVVATDLQKYAVLLAGSIIKRTSPLSTDIAWDQWLNRSKKFLSKDSKVYELANDLDIQYVRGEPHMTYLTTVETVRGICNLLPDRYPLSRAYGGHYFGFAQSLWLDALRATIPKGEHKETAIASLIEAASECSASPGHTAQPFSPTESGMPHLLGAWSRDVVARTHRSFLLIGKQFAKTQGHAYVSDAIKQTDKLFERDLVFLDPPYSEVQYSRFYHVLEGIALGKIGDVSGIGRYPPIKDRPQSNFSRSSPALEEFNNLMIGVAAAGSHALITFPEANASNGLSGQLVENISAQYFHVIRRSVKSTFSTMGGTGATRNARQGTTELILHLRPK